MIRKYWIIIGFAAGIVLIEFLGFTPAMRKYTVALLGIGVMVVACWLLSEAKANNSDDRI